MILGHRLRLRAMTEADLPALYRWRAHPATRIGFAEQEPFSWEDHVRWFQRISADPTEMQLIFDAQPTMAVTRGRSAPGLADTAHEHEWRPDDPGRTATERGPAASVWAPVGSFGLSQLSRRHGRGEFVRYVLDPAMHGKGLAKETDFLVADFGFSVVGLHKMFLDVLAFNGKVIRLHERFGWRIVGTLAEHFWINGRWVDTVLMEQTAMAWLAVRDRCAADAGVDPHYLTLAEARGAATR